VPVSTIPLYEPDRVTLVGFFVPADIENSGGVEIVRNRRGHATRAFRKALSARAVDSSQGWVGKAFPQHLSCGAPVWALQGVRGSR
jgi:hypothetical protein